VATGVTRSIFSPAYVRLREGLTAARVERGLSQAQLAKELARPQSFVSKYESGERRLDFVEVLEIAEVLRLDACDLVRRVREG
jgi:transcriptional regulator with XRE-family HTH domain